MPAGFFGQGVPVWEKEIAAVKDIVTGGETTQVDLDGQQVPTIAKVVRDRFVDNWEDVFDQAFVTAQSDNSAIVNAAIDSQFAALQAQVQGSLAYETKAAMDAAGAPANGELAQVWNDPVNNGLYGYTGGAWAKSPYDPETAAGEKIKASADAAALEYLAPNLIGYTDTFGDAMPLVGSGVTSKSTYNGVPVYRGDADSSVGTYQANWRIDRSLIAGNLVAASVVIDYAEAGTSGQISIVQRDAGLSIIGETLIADGLNSAVTDQVFSLGGVSLDAACEHVELKINFNNTGGAKTRIVYWHAPMLCAGTNASYRPPSKIPSLLADVATNTAGIADNVDALRIANANTTGALLADSHPNIYPDPQHENPTPAWEVNIPAVVTHANRRALQFSSTAVYTAPMLVSEFDAGMTAFCVAIRVLSRTLPAVNSRILVVQFPSNTTTNSVDELARETIWLGDEAWTESRDIVLENIALDPAATCVRLYMDFKATAYVSDICVAQGSAGGLRPISREARVASLEREVDGRTRWLASPNVLEDTGLEIPLTTSVPPTRALEADGTPVLVAPDDGSVVQSGLKFYRESIRGDTFNAGCTVYYMQKTAGRVLVRQMTAAGSEIRDLGDGNGDYRHEFAVDVVADGSPLELLVENKPLAPTCEWLDILMLSSGSGYRVGKFFAGENLKRFNPVSLSFARFHKPAYVATSGSDRNIGTESQPFASLKAAALSGAREIIVADGIYSGSTLELSGDWFRGGMEIRAAQDAMPIARGGTELTGFVATNGRSDVYEVALATAPPRWSASDPLGFVFIKGVPFGLIGAAERHPLHQGRSHICPHHLLKPQASLDDLEAASDPCWFWDDSAQKLYVRSVPGVDPLAMTAVVPGGNFITGLQQHHTLTLVGLGFEFGGLSIARMQRYLLEKVSVFGAAADGFSFNGGHGEDRYCATIACGNDGWNVHNSASGAQRNDAYSFIGSTTRSVDPYAAWNFDDGRSIHEACLGSVEGGLFEYNGSTGFAPANGAEEIIRGALIRHCGWELGVGEQQAGIALVNPLSDDGHGTSCIVHNTTVEGQPYGFGTFNSNARLQLFDTRTINCTSGALRCESGSSFVVHNHLDSGSVTTVGGGGSVTFRNGTVLS